MPSYQATTTSKLGHLSSMHGRNLRSRSGEEHSGQSLWVGLKQDLGAGQATWVQCGLRWFQNPDATNPTAPMGYLETATILNTYGAATTKKNAVSITSHGPYGDLFDVDGLKGWQSAPLVLDFVMWKKITNPYNSDAANPSEWKVIFKDSRAGKSPSDADSYFQLHVGTPTPQLSPAQRLPYENAYNHQKLNFLDANLESNNSISFVPGSVGAKAALHQLRGATRMTTDANPNQEPDTSPALWTWLETAFDWQAITPQNSEVKAIIRTGRNSGDKAETGSEPHPYWNAAKSGDGVELWDNRSYAIPSQP